MTKEAKRGSKDKPINEHNNTLLNRLIKFKPRFLDIRTRMGLDNSVGFGSVPKAHGAYTAGRLLVLEKQHGLLFYPVENLFEMDYYSLNKEYVVIPPEGNDQLKFLSVFQRKGYLEGLPPENKLLTASDEIYEGITAHELGHVIKDLDNRLPEPIQKVLGQIDDDVFKLMQQNNWDKIANEYDLSGEAAVDIIASLYGFKPQILAKLYYMIDCLKQYKGSNDTSSSFFVPPGKAIQVCNARINEVLRYI
jgi:hypothetical protein